MPLASLWLFFSLNLPSFLHFTSLFSTPYLPLSTHLSTFLPSCASNQFPFTRYGWTVRGSNSDEGEIFCTRPDRPWGPSSILYNGYRIFAGVKRSERGVYHTSHIAPRLKKKYSYASTPPLAYIASSKVEWTLNQFLFSPHHPFALSFPLLSFPFLASIPFTFTWAHKRILKLN